MDEAFSVALISVPLMVDSRYLAIDSSTSLGTYFGHNLASNIET